MAIPGKMNLLFCKLTLSVNRILAFCILDDLHSCVGVRLFMTMSSNHIQLSNVVLKLIIIAINYFIPNFEQASLSVMFFPVLEFKKEETKVKTRLKVNILPN